MRILIAEDDVVSRRMLQVSLIQWGYQVVIATDGAEAWQVLESSDAPKLAILDWMMPVMDGVEICRRVREVPRASPAYLILLTARGGNEDIVRGFHAGADDYVTKPFNRDELRARVLVGVRVVELQTSLADRVNELERALKRRQATPGASSDLLLLQENPRRRKLLAASGRLYLRPLRGAIQSRRLPGLLREIGKARARQVTDARRNDIMTTALHRASAPRFASVRRWVNLLALAFFLLTAISSPCQHTLPPAGRLPVLTRVAEIRRLTPAQAQRKFPVHLRAVVTYFEAHPGDLFIQDSTGGIWVDITGTNHTAAAGELLDLEGVTSAPDFAPQVSLPIWKVIGRAPMPAPRRVSFQEMASTREDSQWVEVEGVIRSANAQSGRLTLAIATGSGRLEAVIPGAEHSSNNNLVDARVRIQGACSAKFNDKNQIIGVLLYVPSLSDLYINEAAPRDPYAVPLRSIVSLMQFSPQTSAGHSAKVSGLVTLQGRRTGLFIKDRIAEIYVQSTQTTPLAPGDIVEVVGFPALGEYKPILQDAIFRRTGTGPNPKPVVVTVQQATVGNFNDQLIKIEGRILSSTLLPGDQVLILEGDATKVIAHLSEPVVGEMLDSLRNGSRLRLTGICEAQTAEKGVSRFELFLRSPQDIVVLDRPSWWNVSHAVWMLGLMAAVAALACSWVWALKRRVNAQTGVLLDRLQRIATLEERYRLLFERDPAGVYSATGDGRIVDCNEALIRLFGCTSREQVLAHKAEDFYFDLGDRRAALAQLEKQGTLTNVEFRLRRQDGTPVWGLVNMTTLPASAGDPARIQGTVIDITERKKVEEALHQSEEKTRLIVDTALDAVISMDSCGLITGWSAQAEKVFGWSREEALGRLLSATIIPPQHREAHERGLRHFLDTGKGAMLGRRIEITALRREGLEFPVELSVSPLKLGGVWTFSAFVRDITQRKQTELELQTAKEAAEAANRAKSEFLATMSHEIRTPMNGIIGMTELALGTPLSPEQQEYLSMVKSSADSLLTVINDILDFSKIEAGKLDLEVIEVNLRSSLSSVMKTLALRAHEKGLELACEIKPNVPAILFADSGRLRQVVINLVGNAIKFTERGEVVVRVECESQAGEVTIIHYSVSDTGIGIPHDKQ